MSTQPQEASVSAVALQGNETAEVDKGTEQNPFEQQEHEHGDPTAAIVPRWLLAGVLGMAICEPSFVLGILQFGVVAALVKDSKVKCPLVPSRLSTWLRELNSSGFQ